MQFHLVYGLLLMVCRSVCVMIPLVYRQPTYSQTRTTSGKYLHLFIAVQLQLWLSLAKLIYTDTTLMISS